MSIGTVADVLCALRAIVHAVEGEDVNRLDEYRAVVALRDLGLAAVVPAIEAEKHRVDKEIEKIVKTTLDMPDLGPPVKLRLGTLAREVLGARTGDIYLASCGELEVEESGEMYIITTVTTKQLEKSRGA